MIQTFSPQTPNKPFTDAIRTGRLVGRVDDCDAGGLGHPLKQGAILLVIVADQIRRLLLERRCVPQLLGDPLVRRVVVYSDMYHPSAFMMHDHKGVQRLEKQRHHRDEITGPDGRVGKWRVTWTALFHSPPSEPDVILSHLPALQNRFAVLGYRPQLLYSLQNMFGRLHYAYLPSLTSLRS